MKQFADYAKKRRAAATAEDEREEERMPKQPDEADKRPRVDEAKLCCICTDAQIECAFAPCGHMVTCLPCGESMRDCPICRADILFALKVYT